MQRCLFILLMLSLLPAVVNAQVNIEKFLQDQENAGISGKLGIDFSLKSGNSDVRQIGSSGRLNYNGITFYSFLVFKGEYGWNNGREFSNDALLHWRFVSSAAEKVQWEAFAQIDYNKARLLLFRDLLCGGLRFKLLKTEVLKTRIGTGLFVEQEQYDLPVASTHPRRFQALRASTYLSNEIALAGQVTLTSIVYFQPDVRNYRDWRILSENVLSVDLGKYVDLSITIDLRHDNVPPDGKKKTDLNSRCGLAIKF